MKSIIYCFFVILFYLVALDASAQTSVADGNWATGATWNGGTAPGYTNLGNVTINSYVISDQSISFSNTNNRILTVNDTLIVQGDVLFNSGKNGAGINIGPNNVLIIFGNLQMGKNNAGANIEAGGILVVKGSISTEGNNGFFTGAGSVYTDGTTTGMTSNGSPGPAINVIDDLSTDGFTTIEEYVAGGGAGTLPVDLLYFNASWSQSSKSASLTWATTTEIFNDYFSVERSDDGIDYYEIARVAGHGNSNTKIEYIYHDFTVQSSTSYYRLKQVDFDGEFEYFDQVRLSTYGGSASEEFSLYPSVVTDGQIHLVADHAFNIQEIQIISLNGGRVYFIQSSSVNSTSYQLDVRYLAHGVYLVKTQTEQGELITKKFVVN
ncbi:T9SS type A sorting domain-containing protein [Reichenbachiella agarivorans]|uniref:T9SS type A sorting domain-containing protein n=1 Tax=Reichenbachiella agarivorans TaxID=2979464 RepID=A0ABY6CSF6_9BACT|nr:T9SS type A sorting domain-containing protein [Reichenbachiella agarivorans]UXP32308.1 T9SS type A sorting domain-containing protein [Reichenbachiella agarivorans]